MRRRYNNEQSWDDEPPRKKSSSNACSGIDLKESEVINDIQGRKWKLGKSIGIGGFGEIYQAFHNVSRDNKTDKSSHVAKIEKHTNGPLFVEINCYLRIGKLEMIEEWKKKKKLSFLGMPHYVASGSNIYQGEKYRFLILPGYEKDLQQIFQEKKIFHLKTVLTISSQILDVLEYIHDKGYVHSDIKASNIMLSKQKEQPVATPLRRRITRSIETQSRQKKSKYVRTKMNLRPHRTVNYVDDIRYLDEVLEIYNTTETLSNQRKDNYDRVYLLDYGLASKYLLSNGEHREFSRDERRAHAGTILFCSRDAHKGIPSRRSDLESLAYNMVYWLTGSLPWLEDIEQPRVVEKKKIRCFNNLKRFLEVCFNNDYPDFLLEFFNYLSNLQFEENPNYEYLRNLCKKAVKTYGYKNDWRLDFDNNESCGSRQKKLKRKKVIGCENKLFLASFLKSNSILMPLHSNIIFKRPKLRKKVKNKKIKDSVMNWSKILIDPEVIMKQATKERKTDSIDQGTISLSSIDLESMNPTYAMLEVYNKCKEREFSPKHKGECTTVIDNIEGYTPAMMAVYRRMKERQEFEYEQTLSNNYNRNVRINNKSGRSGKKKLPKRVKRSTSPQSHKLSSRTKSHTNVPQKKDGLQLKKAKSIPLRTYSLRG